MIVHSKIVNKADFDTAAYKEMADELIESKRYHRKAWEFIMMAIAFKERGCLEPGKTGIGFGVGTEPLPAYFAKCGCKVLATDQGLETDNANNWKNSNQICPEKSVLNKRGSCPEDIFNANVEFKTMDMNFIPTGLGKFDFAWSSCALEHLGTLQHGLWYIIRSISLLKPGGFAIHTTEYNLSSNIDTNFKHVNCIYRQQDIEALTETVNSLGCTMEILDTTRGTHEYDTYVDGAGWRPYITEPHLNLKIDGFDATSALLIIQKNV